MYELDPEIRWPGRFTLIDLLPKKDCRDLLG